MLLLQQAIDPFYGILGDKTKEYNILLEDNNLRDAVKKIHD